MRAAPAVVLGLVLLPLAPAAQAEFGAYGPDGWPIAADGSSTNPLPSLTAAELATTLAAGDPLNRVGGTTLFPYWPMLTAEVQRMAKDHPDLVRLQSIGKSTLGLDLWMLEIADFADEGKAGFVPLDEREVVWVDGGHHSNEYSGVYFTLAWAQFLVEQYGSNDTATWIVQNRHTWIMPMVNPDGSNVMGRLNANGVNINRNYPVIWDGEGHDAVMNNRGPSPASEVETRLNIEWFNRTRPDYYATIHCCGNLWLYPYGQEGVDPVDQAMLQKVCDRAFAEVRKFCGPIWSTIYPASGSSVDTAYEYTGTVAFGYEMSGRGAVAIWGQPVTFESVMTQEVESWKGLEQAFLHVHEYGAHPVVTAAAADANGLTVTVRNDGLGNLSAGASSLTLTMPSGKGSKVDLPAIAAGGEATARIPCQEDGAHKLTVTWQKRLEATSNVGHAAVPVTILPAGPTAEALGAAPGAFVVQRAEASAVAAPGLGVALALALVALAAARRRR